jgi:hypothetical protein
LSSDEQPIAYVENLIEGDYTFILNIWTSKTVGEVNEEDFSQDTVKIFVRRSHSLSTESIPQKSNKTVNDNDFDDDYKLDNRLRIHLDENPLKFTELAKRNLISSLEILFKMKPLSLVKPKIVLTKIDQTTDYDKQLLLFNFAPAQAKTNLFIEFYLLSGNSTRAISSDAIMNFLQTTKSTEKKLSSLFQVNVKRVEQLKCFSNCSNHGYCDRFTYKCVCDRYWMFNFYNYYFNNQNDLTNGNNCG